MENTSLATKDQFNPETLNSYMAAMGLASKLTESEKTQFVELAKAFNLNPFTREIYAIKYGNNFSLVIGYEVYLKRAERNGDLAGWSTRFEKEDNDTKCIITIHRKSWSQPLIHEVYLSEYHQKNSMWNTKTKTMLRKVAICQGFRMAFPDELGGMPYGEEELPQAREVVEIAHEVVENTEELENELTELVTGATTLEEAKAVRERLLDSKLDNGKKKDLFGLLKHAVLVYGIDYDATKKEFYLPAEVVAE